MLKPRTSSDGTGPLQLGATATDPSLMPPSSSSLVELIDRIFFREEGEPIVPTPIVDEATAASLPHPVRARLLQMQAVDTWVQERDPLASLALADRSLELADPYTDPLCFVRSMNMAAFALLIEARLAGAAERLVAARWWSKAGTSHGLRLEWRRATINLACCLRALGDVDGAHALNEEVMEHLAVHAADSIDVTHVSSSVISSLNAGKVDRSRHYLAVLDDMPESSDWRAQGSAAHARAAVFLHDQNYGQALHWAERALALYGHRIDADDLAYVCHVAGTACLALEQLERAQGFAERMLQAASEVSEGCILPQALELRGRVASLMGDHETVYALFLEATQTRATRSRSSLAPALHRILSRFQEQVGLQESELLRANRRLEESNADLQGARDQAHEAAHTRHQFLSSMSHEIRTPLHGVLGNAELLTDTDLTESQGEMVGMIRRCATLTLAIVDDILDLRKLEEGKLDLDPVAFPLMRPARDVVRNLGPLAQAAGTEVRIVTDPALPKRVFGDDRRLQQVLLNLSTNAVKFTKEGQVTVRVMAREASVRFEVQDTGIGIPVDRQDAIFDAYVQADRSTSRQAGGTGLGLPICRNLVSLMGGHMGVESAPGEGSTFWFEVPLPEAIGEVPASLTDTEDLTGLCILVAEDNSVSRVVADRMLQSLGASVILVSGGEDAVAQTLKQQPDVVLMDLHMPDLDGDDACRALREQGFSAPILALTASAMERDRELCLAAGMDGFLCKPLTRATLARAVARAVVAHRRLVA
ncbi:MAG: ATP-binding protein [Myxococcota bacterium]